MKAKDYIPKYLNRLKNCLHWIDKKQYFNPDKKEDFKKVMCEIIADHLEEQRNLIEIRKCVTNVDWLFVTQSLIECKYNLFINFEEINVMRKVVWFSCGASSAVAAKLAVNKYGNDCQVVYCDTLSSEHSDNARFLSDIENWIDRKIVKLKNDKYKDIWDVFEKTKYLVGRGARCTVELKKKMRFKYQQVDDIHIFGFTTDERKRVKRFHRNNPELLTEHILLDNNISKKDCLGLLDKAGIELPAMYKIGYRNNNCIGCVKGGAGYWNKIRIDFPEIFSRMSKLERSLNNYILKKKVNDEYIPIYLDELDPKMGSYQTESDIECDLLCHAINI